MGSKKITPPDSTLFYRGNTDAISSFDASAKKHFGDNPTYETQYASNPAWYKANGIERDDALVKQGYTYYEGNPGVSAQTLLDAGFVPYASITGQAGGSKGNGWYLPPGGGRRGSSGGGEGGAGIGGGCRGGCNKGKLGDLPTPSAPKFFTSDTGGGPIKVDAKTLGDIGATVFDKEATGLKGLTTEKGKFRKFKKDIYGNKKDELTILGLNIPQSLESVNV